MHCLRHQVQTYAADLSERAILSNLVIEGTLFKGLSVK
jgi:hypothetical protein